MRNPVFHEWLTCPETESLVKPDQVLLGSQVDGYLAVVFPDLIKCFGHQLLTKAGAPDLRCSEDAAYGHFIVR